MRSELAKMRLERERRQREKEEREAPPISKSLREIEEEERERQEIAMRMRVRDEAIEVINTSIKEDLDESLDTLEGESYRFAQMADERNLDEMVKSLEIMHSELLAIQQALRRFQAILLEVRNKTGLTEDISQVIKATFNPETIKQKVRDALNFLRGIADSILNVNLAIPGARRPVRLLQNIFNIGSADYEFPAYEIVIDMDISRDEEFAKNLARSQERQRQEEDPRFIPFPTRRETSRTRLPSSRRSLGIDDALKIVADNADVDLPTLQVILEAQGFTRDIILDALAYREVVEEPEELPIYSSDIWS